MAKLATPKESDIQRTGIKLLKLRGWHVWRRNVGSMKGQAGNFVRFGEPGQCDTWGFTCQGDYFECEFKRPGKRPTPKQSTWLHKVNAICGLAFWVDNLATLELVAKAIEARLMISYYGDTDDYDLI